MKRMKKWSRAALAALTGGAAGAAGGALGGAATDMGAGHGALLGAGVGLAAGTAGGVAALLTEGDVVRLVAHTGQALDSAIAGGSWTDDLG
jgi:hypothetical protein